MPTIRMFYLKDGTVVKLMPGLLTPEHNLSVYEYFKSIIGYNCYNSFVEFRASRGMRGYSDTEEETLNRFLCEFQQFLIHKELA